jgi:hypothetical protein
VPILGASNPSGVPTSSSTPPIHFMEPNPPSEQRSTTPIPPVLPPRPVKRGLLLVYVHGFKGNETSFKEFPTVIFSRNLCLIYSIFKRLFGQD